MTEQISKLFGDIIRVKVTDGRIIEGQFQAIDKEMNIGYDFHILTPPLNFYYPVVGTAIEYHRVDDGKIFFCNDRVAYCICIHAMSLVPVSFEEGQSSMNRNIGMAIIPGATVVNVYVRKIEA